MPLLIVSGNANKVAQLEAHLGQPLQQVAFDLPEIQATHVQKVIQEKATEAYRQVAAPVLVEDTGLYIDSWNGLPGALIRWFLDSVGNEGICRMLDAFPNRQARAETCIGYYDGENFQTFSGTVHGEIAQSPRGKYGFGWDPIFIPAGSSRTFAEIPPDEKIASDMRRMAALELKQFIAQNLT